MKSSLNHFRSRINWINQNGISPKVIISKSSLPIKINLFKNCAQTIKYEIDKQNVLGTSSWLAAPSALSYLSAKPKQLIFFLVLLIKLHISVTFGAKCAQYLKMDKFLRFLFILVNLHQIFDLIRADEHLQQKFTSKCDDLCINQNENGTEVIFRSTHLCQCWQLIDFSRTLTLWMFFVLVIGIG